MLGQPTTPGYTIQLHVIFHNYRLYSLEEQNLELRKLFGTLARNNNIYQLKMTVEDKIRTVREGQKVSQFAIAYAMGISQAAYSKIERGQTEIKVSQIYLIAAFLNVSVYELLPPSVASHVMGDHLLAPLVHKIKLWWYKRKLIKAEK